jgi:lipopolysaccharide/colanic/teichoic acid biosynthesis glycosyltransferase
MSASVLQFRASVENLVRHVDPRSDHRPDHRSPSTDRRPSRAGAYVLGARLFKDALVRERKRADRLDTPFIVLVVDHSQQPADEATWASILRAAAAARRDVDAVGWLEQDTVLGLLMPETSRHGAAKVMRQMRRQIAMRLGEAAAAVLSMRLYGHGLEASAAADLAPVDLLLDAFVPVRTQPLSDAAKRGLDVVGSLLLLLAFSPIALIAYLAVRWTSPGPALFRQVRIGRRGEPFTMLKFRSMRTDAGHAIHNDYVTWFITSSGQQPRTGDEVFKLTSDPRITPVGGWLRKTSLDELPQFWNVLRGDMSLVGPRPPLPFEVEKYQPWHRRRVLEAKPGITGLWQVKGRSRTTFDEMVRMDLAYVRTRTLWTDIKILVATPLAMVKGAV